MSSTPLVALILGAGPRVGHAVAKSFVSKGYKVAVPARSLNESDSTPDQLNIKSDFSKPNEVVNAFQRARKELGTPNVVIYNAGAAAFPPKGEPFAITLEEFERDMTVNTTSVWVAAQQAVRGFAELAADVPKLFTFTGNILNVVPLPQFLSSGAGKAASAHIIRTAALELEDQGYRFYYLDERKPDGSAAFKVDGDAHVNIISELLERKTQGPWLQTFVKGEGYKDFGPYKA